MAPANEIGYQRRTRSPPQQQQVFPVIDVDFGPLWEFQLRRGVGVGTTASTDHLIVKCILGRRFDWTRKK